MKRLIFLSVVMSVFFIFFGCAGLQLNRTVDENNVFISTGKPKIKIKVNEPFWYTKQSNSSHFAGSFSGGETSTREKKEVFIFNDSKVKGRKLLFIITSLRSSRWEYLPSNFSNMDGAIDHGVMTIGGLQYQYQTRFEIHEKSLCIVKTLIRCVGTRNNCKFMIVLREPAIAGNLGDKIKKIDENFLKAFDIL